MDNKRLDVLIRKNKGKRISTKYKDMFVRAGFNDAELTYVDLEETDELINRVKEIFPSIKREVEILSENSMYVDSNILTAVFGEKSIDECYVFSDDFDICGMYMTNAEAARRYCLNVAKLGYSNTCFILDKLFRFWFTINFYREGDGELINKFDIQVKIAD